MVGERQSLAEYVNEFDAPLVAEHRPWPRLRLSRLQWSQLIDDMALRDWSLVGLWAERTSVHQCLRDEKTMELFVLSLDCPEGSFPSLSPARPSAQRLERVIRDLFGLIPEGFDDGRAWLDHDAWPVKTPLAAAPVPHAPEPSSAHYAFLPVDGEGLHQIPVGPVHAGIIEPGHFRFHCNGEAVARLEERLGYVHKGVEKLVEGKTLDEAARIVGRLSGDATVAYALAFARAAEAALNVAVPPRAHGLRALMAELERIAHHFGDVGAICNDAAFSFMLAHCGALRERTLRAAQALFGHRLMMDRVIPGGVAVDLPDGGGELLKELAVDCRRRLDELTEIYDDKPSLLDRTKETGFLAHHLVERFAAGGPVGRASGRGHDARRSPGYPPYDELEFEVPKLASGDVAARLWIRVMEIHASLGMIEQIVEHLPVGPLAVDPPAAAGEGMALVESFRGEILLWLRLDAAGRVARCHPRDPSWFQWPLLEAAIEGNIVADFPLCNKSFNCSYSGHDL